MGHVDTDLKGFKCCIGRLIKLLLNDDKTNL